MANRGGRHAGRGAARWHPAGTVPENRLTRLFRPDHRRAGRTVGIRAGRTPGREPTHGRPVAAMAQPARTDHCAIRWDVADA